jgi:hypothetical protein
MYCKTYLVLGIFYMIYTSKNNESSMHDNIVCLKDVQ